jgi:hypothetical protein
MRHYTVHLRRHGLDPDRDLVLVKEGFSWPAFFFSMLWALWLRLWLVAVLFLLVQVILSLVLALWSPDPVSAAAVSAGATLILAFAANDLRRWTLRRLGFVETAVVAADDRDGAERRFLDGEPALAADLRR